MARLDESEIYKWFDVFKNGNQLVEIRLIGSNKNGSGYFSDPQTLIESIKPYSDSFNISKQQIINKASIQAGKGT